jgi:branched-chain amino acid aminotransferase
MIINHMDTGPLAQKLYQKITGIQYGREEDPFGWVKKVTS